MRKQKRGAPRMGRALELSHYFFFLRRFFFAFFPFLRVLLRNGIAPTCLEILFQCPLSSRTTASISFGFTSFKSL